MSHFNDLHFVLASKSPRRRELLPLIGIKNFDIIPAENEETLDPSLSPSETVMSLALQKAQEVSLKAKNAVVISADTLVFLDGKPLGKPVSAENARKMLKELSGKSHLVYTGICLAKDGKFITDHECSTVYFRDLTDNEINGYVASGESLDKAGGYGAQGLGSILVKRIDGDFFNIMGLPVCKLYCMLKNIGIELLKVD